MGNEMENRIWEMHKKGFTDLEIARELEIDTEDVEKIIEQKKKEHAEYEEKEKTKEEVPEERERNEQLEKEIDDAMCFPMRRTAKI